METIKFILAFVAAVYAWHTLEEIKNRKGKMINGTFVKESDL